MRWTSVYFGWRTNLPDEADNHLIEWALAGRKKNDPTIDVKMATAKALVTQKGGSLICHAQSEGDRWDLLNDQPLAPCSENVECPMLTASFDIDGHR